MNGRLKPPEGGDEAPAVSARLGKRGPTLDLVALATQVCRRYRAEFPDEKKRYGDAGNAWCVHDNQHLLNWAVEATNGYFDIRHEVAWLASVLEARGFPVDRLARTLDLCADVVQDQVTGTGTARLTHILTDTALYVRSHGSFLGYIA